MCDGSTVVILEPVSENPWSSASIRDSFEQSFEHIYSKPRVRQDRNDGHTTRQDLSRSRRNTATPPGWAVDDQEKEIAVRCFAVRSDPCMAGHSRLRPESVVLFPPWIAPRVPARRTTGHSCDETFSREPKEHHRER
jgi:hypothetical protein